MKIVITLFALISVLSLSGCGSTASLDSHGKNVRIVKKEPLECKELGRFYGSGTATKYAMNNLLNIVGKNGGTHVYVSRVSDVDGVGATFVVGNDHTAYGIGFKCN